MLIKSWIFAALAASSISSWLVSLLTSPYAMLSRIEQLKRTGSWETIPIWRRSHETFKALTSLPSTNFKESKKILLSLLYLFLYFSFDEWNSNLWAFVGLCSSSLVLHFTFYCISVIQIHYMYTIKMVHFECELFQFQLHWNIIFVLHCTTLHCIALK